VTVLVRKASTADAVHVARIYADGIRACNAAVVAIPPSPDDIRERILGAADRHTWLVAQDDEEVIGWAATMPYARPVAYAEVAKFSVYVDPARQGGGAGRLLMSALMAASEAAGVYKLTSRVFYSNTASRKMLAAVGFREVGTHFRHVKIGGTWRDVVIVEALLGDARPSS
jgi:phosphinothricin acetyltransferase